MRELVVVAGLAAAVLAACAQDSGGGSDEDGPDDPATSLTITVQADPESGEEPRVMTLECDPVGGDHPNAQAACEVLAGADPGVFEPVPEDQPCTMIYGGPQEATITGSLDGVEVDARFIRQNGCEIARWDALGTAVFDVPIQ
ncbi:SSI family serine proteinase inhibitor [Aeromicrobium halocynthiae]|uniref:SSI family serine proteinase inhibitor n=1 Tax=Aeromicrobium halocynthiae TaxID=560557 RepID=A0ABN2W3U7_9ACTN